MIRFARRVAAAWISLGALIAIAHAETGGLVPEPPLIPVPIDTVLVTAERLRPEAWISRLPAFATVRELDDATERLVTIADVLEASAGVRVRRYGHLGAFTTASIRGSSPGQVEVYLDGIPINSAQWGVTNLAELPIANLSRAEIFRSAAPAEFSSPGIGGVVNLVSRPVSSSQTILSATGGSFGTWRANLLNTGRSAGFEHLVALHQLRTRGDFAYRHDPGTPVTTGDDTIHARENNDFQEWGVLAKLESPPLYGWRLTLRDDWYLKESGLPGHGNLVFHDARFENRRHMTSLTARSPALFRHRARATVTGFHTYRRDRYFNPAKEPGLNRNDLVHRTNTDGAQALLAAYWFEARQVWKLSGEIRREQFVPEEKHPRRGVGFTRERVITGLAVEDAQTVWTDRTSVHGTFRYRRVRDNFFGPTPFTGTPAALKKPHRVSVRDLAVGARVVAARFAAGPELTLKANRNAYSRFPTLFELFGTSGEVLPNTELVPETGVTWDAGFVLRVPDRWRRRGELEVCAFHSTRDSLVTFVQNARGAFVAMNLEQAIAKGIEVNFDAEIPPGLRVEGSFTSQDVRQSGRVPHWNDKWLPYVSPRELFLRTSIDLRRVVPRHVVLRYEYRFFDWYFQDRANLPENRVAPRRLHNLGVRVRTLGGRLTLDLDLQNVFDKRISDVYGYPLPGRTLYLTLEIDTAGHPRPRVSRKGDSTCDT